MSFYTHTLTLTHTPSYAELAATSPLLLPVSKRADWNNGQSCEFYLTANFSGPLRDGWKLGTY